MVSIYTSFENGFIACISYTVSLLLGILGLFLQVLHINNYKKSISRV